jgi:hypothetical protein
MSDNVMTKCLRRQPEIGFVKLVTITQCVFLYRKRIAEVWAFLLQDWKPYFNSGLLVVLN